jgi:hypothetical protein
MAKINFTPEHESRLKELALKFLFLGVIFQGIVNTNLTLWALIHDVTIQTLQRLLGNMKREIKGIEDLDRWSLTRHQELKLGRIKEQYEFVDLLIGYKMKQKELEEQRLVASAIKKELKELKNSQLKPEDKILSLENQLKAMGEDIEEDDTKPEEGTTTA